MEKEAKDKIKARHRALCTKQPADAAKQAIPKPHITQAGGKTSHKQIAAKAACKGDGVPTNKPQRNYAIIAMREIRRFQKSVDLLILLLPFQCLICEIAQDFRMGLFSQWCHLGLTGSRGSLACTTI